MGTVGQLSGAECLNADLNRHVFKSRGESQGLDKNYFAVWLNIRSSLAKKFLANP